MKTFRVTYHLRSATASAWQADTIFGHLCWALRYLDGEKELTEFLEWYDKDIGEPPIIVSDGFPGDLLPNPILPPPQNTGETPLKKADDIKAFDDAKKARKAAFLTLDEFNRAINGETVQPEDGKPVPKTRVTLKNQISRLTGTTGEGGNLFEFEETFWGEMPVSIYVKVGKGFEDKAERLFRFVAEQGYGKRKSVGYGEIRAIEFEDFNGFNPPANADGFVALSHFVPAKDDPRDGFWKVLVKYGKLGEEYAAGENPFKRPLVMLTPGSVFHCDGKPKEFYGRLVEGVSARGGVVQYAYAFPVPMKLAELG